MQEMFRLNTVRWVSSLFFAFMAFAWIRTVLDPGLGGRALQVISACLAIASTWAAVRGWRSGTVVAAHDGAVYRSLLRDRRWSWDEIDRFEVRDGRVGVLAYRRRVLWVVLQSGAEHKLEELNQNPRTGDSELERYSARLNELANRG